MPIIYVDRITSADGLRRYTMGWAYKKFVEGQLVADVGYGSVRSRL